MELGMLPSKPLIDKSLIIVYWNYYIYICIIINKLFNYLVNNLKYYNFCKLIKFPIKSGIGPPKSFLFNFLIITYKVIYIIILILICI